MSTAYFARVGYGVILDVEDLLPQKGTHGAHAEYRIVECGR